VESLSGAPIRQWHLPWRFQYLTNHSAAVPLIPAPAADEKTCLQWGVVMTNNLAATSLRQFSALAPEWCLVVVGDAPTPVDWPVNAPGTSCVYLDELAQRHYLLDYFPEIMLLPWHHVGRKMVGYLYAIHHGAVRIWDFDEHILLADGAKIRVPGHHNLDFVDVLHAPPPPPPLVNPYGYFNTVAPPHWPRGVSPTLGSNPAAPPFAVKELLVPGYGIAVLQSLAVSQPDGDATTALPGGSPDGTALPRLLLLPSNVYAPFNTDACLFQRSALWMMYLPITVPNYVADIWRSYLGQRLLRDLKPRAHVAFSAPFVTRESPADADADADSDADTAAAELSLERHTSVLIDFLNAWHSTAPDLPGRMEQLMVALFERGFVEEMDVLLAQNWLTALQSLRYPFPPLTQPQFRTPWSEILVIVRCNFGHFEIAQRFVELWGTVFPHIIFFGDDSSGATQDVIARMPPELRAKIVVANDDPSGGRYYRQIPDLIDRYPEYRGYLVMHDDMYLRIDRFTHIDFDKFWISDTGPDNNAVSRSTRPSSWVWPNDQMVLPCFDAVENPQLQPFRDNMQNQCGFPAPLVGAPGDMFYVPAKLKAEWNTIARVFGDISRPCYLEIAVPTIGRCVLPAEEVLMLPLYTVWDNRRNSLEFIDICMNSNAVILCHPLKLGLDVIWERVRSFHFQQVERYFELLASQ
jgi:hypothetical protein